MAIITAICWAILAIALKFAVQKYSSGTIVWVRLELAFLCLLIAFTAYKPKALRAIVRPPKELVAAALLIAANYYGYMKGVELTSATSAQVLIQMAPLTFAVLSTFYFREHLNRKQLIGIAVALSGFALFFCDQIMIAVDNFEKFKAGNVWMLVAIVTWAYFALLQKKTLKKMSAQEYNLVLYFYAALALFPTSNPSELLQMDMTDFWLFLFLGLNTVIAYGAFSEALQRIPGNLVSMIVAVNPLLTLLVLQVFLWTDVQIIPAEPIHWLGYLGAFCVVIGVIIALRERRT